MARRRTDTLLADDGLLGAEFTDTGQDRGVLAERMLAPPFSVLDTKQGWWQERKRAWISLGIKSELGRDAVSYQGPGRTEQPTGQPYYGTRWWRWWQIFCLV